MSKPFAISQEKMSKIDIIWSPVVEREFIESQYQRPLSWGRSKQISVCPMSDLFHPDVPDKWRDRVFGVMAIAAHHTYQILTRNTNQMLEYLSDPNAGKRWGTLIENELMSSPCLGHLIDELEDDFILDNVHLVTTTDYHLSGNKHLTALSERGWKTFVLSELEATT